MDVFSRFGDLFGELIAGGADRLMPFADGLAFAMVGFAVVAASLGAIMGGNIMSASIRVIIGAGVYLGIMHSAQWLSEALMESSVQFGLEAGNTGQNAAAFLRSPDAIFRIGYVHANDLWDLAGQLCHVFSFFGCGDPGIAITLMAAGWIVWGAFALAAFLVLSTSILFKLAALLGITLLPLAMFETSRQFGVMPIKACIHFAVQLATLACVTGTGSIIFSRLTVHADPTMATAMPYIVAGLVFIGLILGASRLAYSLTSGAMLAGGALLGAPAGISVMAARSGFGQAAGPMSAGAKAIYSKMSGAASVSTKSVMK